MTDSLCRKRKLADSFIPSVDAAADHRAIMYIYIYIYLLICNWAYYW